MTKLKLRPSSERGRAASLPLVLSSLAVLAVAQAASQLNNFLPQYGRASAPAQSLVSAPVGPNESPQPTALLLRRQPLQTGELDNVIESSTANSLQQLAFGQAARGQQAATVCQLPPTWAGKWHQANKEPVRVTNTEISDKGICRDKKGDKYLFEYAKQPHQTCLTCLVINERHLNVLQYKESSCQPMPAAHLNRTVTGGQLLVDADHSLLDSICSDITGDAQLESLFRLETPAIECPISGKYHFTYDNCREPQSTLDSCIDKKQLHFKFSACPDTAGSESKSEVLKCYADWSEGNNYYMIGRLEHASNHQDRGKFRCFLYEKSASGDYIQMAQSLEESCYGLINANEGPKTLRLTSRAPASNNCHFPAHIQSQTENWLSVDNSLIYMFNQNSTKYQVKETKEGNVIEEATCLQQFTSAPPQAAAHPRALQAGAQSQPSRRFPPSSDQFSQINQATVSPAARLNDIVYLVQITKDCYTTDYCVRFYRRTSGIVQIDYFVAVSGVEGRQRCQNAYIGTPQTQIITTTTLEPQKCPFDGAYSIEAPVESDFSYNPSNIFICPRRSFLTAQCEQASRLRIHYQCSPAKYMVKNLYCLGTWTTGGLVRLILSDDERLRYSAWYRDTGATFDSLDTSTGSSIQAARSQQLGLAPAGASAAASLASIVDLQIALITPLSTITKPMQVRLTRRNNCSELRSYSSQGSLSPVPSYASPSASSSAAPQPSSINLFQTVLSGDCNPAVAFTIAMTLISLLIASTTTVTGAAAK